LSEFVNKRDSQASSAGNLLAQYRLCNVTAGQLPTGSCALQASSSQAICSGKPVQPLVTRVSSKLNVSQKMHIPNFFAKFLTFSQNAKCSNIFMKCKNFAKCLMSPSRSWIHKLGLRLNPYLQMSLVFSNFYLFWWIFATQILLYF